MAQLTVDYHLLPDLWHVPVGQVVHLDRVFLSEDASDLSISRAPHAPVVRHRDGEWWLDNDSAETGAKLAVHLPDTKGTIAVPRRCSVRLVDGDCEVWVWNERYRVLLMVSGSTTSAAVTRSVDGTTQVGLPEAVRSVRKLFRNTPRHRAVLAAYYRPYFERGIVPPVSLTRKQTIDCLGLITYTELDRALRETMNAIWGEQGHGAELPEFLISRQLLTAADQELVPHRRCGHSHR